jgi:hypothetical protein
MTPQSLRRSWTFRSYQLPSQARHIQLAPVSHHLAGAEPDSILHQGELSAHGRYSPKLGVMAAGDRRTGDDRIPLHLDLLDRPVDITV